MDNKSLILILWDQLSLDISSLKKAKKDRDLVLLVEASSEASLVPHHKKKLVFLFSAMRHFKSELLSAGWQVVYQKLEDLQNSGSLIKELKGVYRKYGCDQIIVTKPGEWQLYEKLKKLDNLSTFNITIPDDTRYICSSTEFEEWAAGRQQLRMENFYRNMRRKTGLLLTDKGEPEGGQWNFDKDNRKPANKVENFYGPKRFKPDLITQEAIKLIASYFPDNYGVLEPFWFAVTRTGAEEALQSFIENSLASFGTYQDALLKEEAFLFHSIISLYLNIGFLDPLVVCERVEDQYRQGRIPLNSAEGFIRQIIGWREFIRGIYWLKMPRYQELNFFQNSRKLPEFYWTGKTNMACLSATLQQTMKEAYAHHIQRLMITGNFAMLAGIDPKAVHEWYLSVYADAHEWVELPNTLGMSQFADGGTLATKPYAASGNYINKMSNYCSSCSYDVKKKVGKGACPFNYLYWDFLDRNKHKLEKNPRLSMPYRMWKSKDEKHKEIVRSQSAEFLKSHCGDYIKIQN